MNLKKTSFLLVGLVIVLIIIIWLGIKERREAPSKITPPKTEEEWNLEKVNQLSNKTKNYKAKLTILKPNGEIWQGDFYLLDEKAKFNYQREKSKITSIFDPQIKGVLTYDEETKKAFFKPQEENPFKPSQQAEIIKTSEEVNGKDCLVIENESDKQTMQIWIDKNEGVILKVKNSTPEGDTIIYWEEIVLNEASPEELVIPEELEIVELPPSADLLPEIPSPTTTPEITPEEEYYFFRCFFRWQSLSSSTG